MGRPGKDDRDAEEAPPFDEWSIHKAYREGASKVVSKYRDEAQRLLLEVLEGSSSRNDGMPNQETKKWALYLAREYAALEHPLPGPVVDLLAACLGIKEPYKFPDIPARVKQDWIKAIKYEASLAPDLLLDEEFKFASSSKVAQHLWPHLDPIDSRKTVGAWHKNPAYRRDVHQC